MSGSRHIAARFTLNSPDARRESPRCMGVENGLLGGFLVTGMEGLWGSSPAQKAGTGSPRPSGSTELPLLGVLESQAPEENQAAPQLEGFSTLLFYFLDRKTEGRQDPSSACGAAVFLCAPPTFSPASIGSPQASGMSPYAPPDLSEETRFLVKAESEQPGWPLPPASCPASVGLPPALGDDFLWLGAHVPLHPGAVVDGHVGLATEVGPQCHVAGCDARAARGHQWLGQIHLLVLEQTADLLGAFLQALLGQEVRERDVHGAGDVARFDACGRRAGRRELNTQGGQMAH